MSNSIIDIDLILLKQEIKNDKILYCIELHKKYNSKLWNYFKKLKQDHQKLISYLVKKNCIFILKYDNEEEDYDELENNYEFDEFYIYHWTLILFESLLIKNKEIIDLSTEYLNLDNLFHYKRYYNLILKILIEQKNPDLFILFIDHCKGLNEKDHYICFKGEILNDLTILNMII